MLNSKLKHYQYYGIFAEILYKYVAEKRGFGVAFNGEAKHLAGFDKFTVTLNLQQQTLTKEVVEKWMQIKPNENENNHSQRIRMVRRLAIYMKNQEYESYVCPTLPQHSSKQTYIPYIYTENEVSEFFNQASQLPSNPQSRNMPIIMPVLFKLLYSTGMRINEVLQLKVGDVDLIHGVIQVLQSKSKKPRYVPISNSMLAICRGYSAKLHAISTKEDWYFPTQRMTPYSMTRIYYIFREVLFKANIPHLGRGQGPRIHDFRHTFAVECLKKMVRQKCDVTAIMPYISMYLGHNKPLVSQYYLRLTADMYPELTKDLDAKLGDIIPKLEVCNENN